MPAGVRHSEWMQLRIAGDRAAALPHVPAARKFLGEVISGAAFAELGVATLRRTLPDGTVIVAEKIGDIPRVTIRPAPPALPKPPATTPDDIVVWARDAARPDGIDAEHPQQILRPSGPRPYSTGAGDGISAAVVGGARSWEVFTYDSQTDGHRTGTYIGLFPDGIPHAGNVDWCGANGERVSWYGPSTRYWYEPYVQMTAQYGKKVFALGQVLLDTEDYAQKSAQGANPQPDFNEKWVMGAGIHDGWLYVMQAQAVTLNTPLPDPAATYPPGAVYYLLGPTYSTANIRLAACRYLLAEVDGQPGYVVVPKTREVLWASSGNACALNPWFFNPDCSEAVTFTLPKRQFYGSAIFAAASDSATARLVLSITRDGDVADAGITTYDESLAPYAGEAAIAADYLRDGTQVEIRVRRRSVEYANVNYGALRQRFDFLVGGAAVEFRSLSRAESGGYLDVHRWVMWADARAGALICRRQEVVFRDPPGAGVPFKSVQTWLEVWLGGTRALNKTDGRTDYADSNNSFGAYLSFSANESDHESDNISAAMSPMLVTHGYCYGHSSVLGTDTPHPNAPAHAGFCYLPRQPEVMFGYYMAGRIGSNGADIRSTTRVFAEVVNATPGMARIDKDGMDVVLGAAATDGIVVLSAYPKGAGEQPPEHVVVATGGSEQLPELTGITGGNSRFHPIWKLGKPLRKVA